MTEDDEDLEKAIAKDFWDFKDKNPDSVRMFNSIDELIISAYNYVEETGFKVNYIHIKRSLLAGLKTEDNKYFMARLVSIKTGKHELYDNIKSIGVSDFVNRQLIAFI